MNNRMQGDSRSIRTKRVHILKAPHGARLFFHKKIFSGTRKKFSKKKRILILISIFFVSSPRLFLSSCITIKQFNYDINKTI